MGGVVSIISYNIIYNQMGQDPLLKTSITDQLLHFRHAKFNKQPKQFIRDPRLIENIIFVPELFAGVMDAQVKKIQRLIQLMPYHILQTEIIDGLNQRFSKILKMDVPIIKLPEQNALLNIPSENNNHNHNHNHIINKSNSISSLQTRSKNTPKNKYNPEEKSMKDQQMEECKLDYFYELETQEKFMKLLEKFQHWFYIQKQLNRNLSEWKYNKTITIRKKVNPTYESKLDRHMFSKLYLIYYLKVLKYNFASKDKARNHLILDFHNSIGKMICEMIEYNHFNDKKLIHLAYKIIYLEKTGSMKDLELILGEIKKEFWPFYLTKEHNLSLKREQYNRIRQVSRCYLDQLYLRCLKQAEDPDIIQETNEGFGILRNFPIVRVREDKHR